MKLSAYIITILILAVTVVFFASADEMNNQNVPGQQTPQDQINGSPQAGMNDDRNPNNNQNAQQQAGQNIQSPTVHTTPVTQNPQSEQNPGTGPQTNKQTPTPQQTIQEPQKKTPATPTPDMTQREPVQNNQPTQKTPEPQQSQTQAIAPGTGGQYQNIQFPPSYPHFKQDYAVIQVTSDPIGASVYLDGSYKGMTPSSGYLELSDLSPGTYTVQLTMSGYTDYTTQITLPRNEIVTISADLTSTYVPSNYGALSVQSTPSGAEVYLDNEYKGITPVTLQMITTGSHTVLIKKDDYSSYSGDVYIIPDQASALSVSLSESATPTPTVTQIPAQPPAPVPTKSPLSPWIAIGSLAVVGLIFTGQRMRR